MKVRYSVEAFALAMVLFTTGLEAALIAGAVVVAGTVLGDILAEKMAPKAAPVVAGIVTAALLIGGMSFAGLMELAANVELIGAILVAVLVAKHVSEGTEGAEGNVIKENYVALAIMLVVALVREVLAGGAVFGYEVAEFTAMSASYGKNPMGLVFAGLGMAAVAGIVKKEAAGCSRCVAIAIAVMTVAGAVLGGGNMVKAVVSACISVVALVSIQKKMIFSTPGKSFAGFPVEVISLGFVTMMLSQILA